MYVCNHTNTYSMCIGELKQSPMKAKTKTTTRNYSFSFHPVPHYQDKKEEVEPQPS